MGNTDSLGGTVVGLLMLMAGFASAGFFSGRLGTLAALACISGGAGLVLWSARR